MSNVAYTVNLVHLIFGCGLLYVIWRVGMRDYLLDKFRSRLFDLRDELFEKAKDGDLDFDDPHYRTVRAWLNAVIRSAHRIALADALAIYAFAPDLKSEKTERFFSDLQEVQSGEHGEDLQRCLIYSHVLIGKYFILRSPLMWVILPLLFVVGLFRGAFNSVKDRWDKTLGWVGRQMGSPVSYAGYEDQHPRKPMPLFFK